MQQQDAFGSWSDTLRARHAVDRLKPNLVGAEGVVYVVAQSLKSQERIQTPINLWTSVEMTERNCVDAMITVR